MSPDIIWSRLDLYAFQIAIRAKRDSLLIEGCEI